MKRLKRYRYPLIGLTLLVLLWAIWNGLQFFCSPSRINSANFAKIKEGMSQEEVCAILGDPKKPPNMKYLWIFITEDDPPWVTNCTMITILFDVNDRVEKACLFIEKRSLKERFAKYLPD